MKNREFRGRDWKTAAEGGHKTPQGSFLPINIHTTLFKKWCEKFVNKKKYNESPIPPPQYLCWKSYMIDFNFGCYYLVSVWGKQVIFRNHERLLFEHVNETWRKRALLFNPKFECIIWFQIEYTKWQDLLKLDMNIFLYEIQVQLSFL